MQLINVSLNINYIFNSFKIYTFLENFTFEIPKNELFNNSVKIRKNKTNNKTYT